MADTLRGDAEVFRPDAPLASAVRGCRPAAAAYATSVQPTSATRPSASTTGGNREDDERQDRQDERPQSLHRVHPSSPASHSQTGGGEG